jgi:hypothetical protein
MEFVGVIRFAKAQHAVDQFAPLIPVGVAIWVAAEARWWAAGGADERNRGLLD